MYYYIGPNNQQMGPVPAEQLISRGVTGETMVWTEGMTQWQKAKDVPALGAILNRGYQSSRYDDQSTRYSTPPPNYGNYGYQRAGQFGNQPTGHKPDNHLVWAILTTIFCCLPFGIVSIVYSTKVDPAWNMGDQLGAEENSRKAKNWALASALTSLGISVIYITEVSHPFVGVL